MTAIVDATAMIEALIGREVSGEELRSIGDSFVTNDPYQLGGWYVVSNPSDPEEDWIYVPREPTNEEIAQHFLNTMLKFGQTVHRDASEHKERQILIQNIDDAVTLVGDDAVLDFT